MHQLNKLYNCFSTTPKGLELLLATELESLGASNTIPTHGGVTFNADFKTIMRANLSSRLASRIMIQIGFGEYESEQDIYNITYKINWPEIFEPKQSIKVKTTAINSPLKSLDFISLKVKDAVCDKFMERFNSRPNVNKSNPDIRIYNFLTQNTITIYLDTSGEGLFKRGYRENKLEAPLKENLAFGLIKLSNWDKKTPLYDPMCGSGTIVIEALSYALNIPPNLTRGFAFEKLLNFKHEKLSQIKHELKQLILLNSKIKIYASDISQKAIQLTLDNLKRANMNKYLDLIQVKKADFRNTQAPEEEGIIITNPPYGIRLGEAQDLNELYAQIATNLKQNFTNWNCYFLSPLKLQTLLRLKPSRKISIFNGPLECRLFEFKMVAGQNRKAVNQ